MKIKLFVLCSVLMISGCGIDQPESGQHSGMITDVSQTGFFCTTWEGQIISGNGNSPLHYEFTIIGEDTINKLKIAQNEKREVIITYTTPFFHWSCGSNGTNVTHVEFVK